MRHGIGLIVKVARPFEGSRWRHPFGSTARHLIRKAPCPVWILREDAPAGPTKILVAVDLVTDDTTRLTLCDKLLQVGTTLAALGDASLRVAHAWELWAEFAGRAHPGVASLPRAVQRAKLRARERVDAFVERHRPALRAEDVYCIHGKPEAVLPELIVAERVDLLVMGSIGRVGLGSSLLGERAEEILNRVECPVLVVKPDGFVSPLSDRVSDPKA